MNDDFRKELSEKISEERIEELTNYVANVADWNLPTPDDLVIAAELHQLLLFRGFVYDRPLRFDLMDIAEKTGLDNHTLSAYTEIGNWIAMDRGLCELDADEIDQFYEKMGDVVESIRESGELDEILSDSVNEVEQRNSEIAELNKLFYGNA